jgi:DNA-binding transcriptional MocR family regulator
MSDDRKRRLMEILNRHGLPLIEDDAYGELHHGETPLRPAKAWDTEGLVLHCSSFTKSLAPGYRIGWVAPGRYFREVARQKVATTLMASMPGQAGIAAYLQRRGYDRHLRRLRQVLAARHEEFAQAVCRHFPEGTCATRPEGGYFMWLQMPRPVDAFEMQRFAQAHGISVAPGPLFSAAHAFGNCVRLNFSHGMNDRTERALALLGKFAKMASMRKAA